MAYANAHQKRWERHFSDEPWWDGHLATYEYLADHEDGEKDLVELVYALAKARGIDTTQICPSCKMVVDEPRSFDPRDHDPMSGCTDCHRRSLAAWNAALAAERAEKEKREAAERVYQSWYATLTPEQRAAEDERRAEIVAPMRFMIDGLIKRGVQ